jgi:ABC-type Fe3+/spermidine/putrescine transport system ATPase subunit
MPLLEIRRLSKSYPDGWTLHQVSFTVEDSDLLCLLGPSGCGKTTLLRLIAGLEAPDGGQVLVDGSDVTHVPPHLRGFGLMFQEYALFPHKDVFGNVAFGLRMQGLDRETVSARVAEVLGLVGLVGFEHRDVNQLSGGERQRVALARSLAPQPRLLMLDEPLGALDRALRERLMDDLPDILHRAGVTAITVTHDQEEAFALADRVVLMRDGRVVQDGTPEEVYRRPASAWAAHFLGLTNLLDARVTGRGRVETTIGTLHVRGLEFEMWDLGLEAQVLIRPEAARLDEAGPNILQGVVTECSFRGEHYRLGVRHSSGVELAFNFPASAAPLVLGAPITLSLAPRALMLLPSG